MSATPPPPNAPSRTPSLPQPQAAPAQGGPAQVAPAETPGLAGLLTLAVGVVVIAALYVGKEVFVPVVLAILLSFVLAPVVDLLRRLRLGRAPAVILAVLLALSVIGGIGSLIGVQVAELAGDLPRYETTITRKVGELRSATVGRAAEIVRRLGTRIQRAAEPSPSAPSEVASGGAAPAEKPMLVEVREPSATPLQLAQRVLGPVVHPLATTGIVLVVAIFILMQREDLRDRLIRLFGSGDLHRTTAAMDDAARRLSKYFLTQLALNAVFGLLIGTGLWFIGVPSPVLWGVFAGLMRFVPYIGALIAGIVPVALAAAVDPTGWSMALWTLALFALLEPVMGHGVEPLVYGHSTGMSPFAVIVSALFWTWLWGPIGLLLSTPFTVVLVVLGRHVERLEFLDVLFGDRPALTPVESFYQRMLAGDADEVQEHAELLLKERSLSSYYDEVALKGLQLAANDGARGVLTPQQIDTIRRSMQRLVGDLAEYEDAEPRPEAAEDADPAGPTLQEKDTPKGPAPAGTAPAAADLPEAWRHERAVLCIAGRGPLDEGASAMLAQLLRKHGLGAELVPHEAVSRDNLASLDVTGVAMVCISYLEISGRPAHLRYLLRRLRQKLARGAPILVGLWPSEDQILTDQALRSQVGADHYVVSLREALKACLAAAHAAARTGDAAQGLPPDAPAPVAVPRRADAGQRV